MYEMESANVMKKSVSITKIAREIGLSIREARVRAIKLLIYDELRKVRAEKHSILIKYNISSLKELLEKIEEGVVSDVDVHGDLVRLDYLEYREKNF